MTQCGVSEVVITPPLGSKIPGTFQERRVEEIKDDLYVKAVVIQSGNQLVAFAVVDALFILAREVRRISDRVYDFTGIPAEQIMISATHTHTGPPIWPGWDESYLDQFVIKAADAIILAYRRLQPVKIGFGRGYEDTIAFNRRYWMKDGTVQTNPGFQHPQLVSRAGPSDPEVLVMRIDDVTGKPLAVVTNFACHPDTVGGREICADYPGELSRSLKKVLGERVVSLFLQGASGNINHNDYTQPRRITVNHYRKMGRILAREVLKVYESIDVIDVDDTMDLVVKQSRFPMRYRYPTDEEIRGAKATLQSNDVAELERMFAVRLLEILENPQQEAEMEIQLFCIGDMAVIGLPGELFAEFGLELKSMGSFPYTMVNTLCNGTNTGYVCTREAYEQGGYEPRLRNLSRNRPGTGELSCL